MGNLYACVNIQKKLLKFMSYIQDGCLRTVLHHIKKGEFNNNINLFKLRFNMFLYTYSLYYFQIISMFSVIISWRCELR